jgi:hypothetical protein
MARLFRSIGLGALLCLAVLPGCHKNAVQHKDPPDPMLVTKKPVEGRIRTPSVEENTIPEPPAPPESLEPSLPPRNHPPELSYPSILDVRALPDRDR